MKDKIKNETSAGRASSGTSFVMRGVRFWGKNCLVCIGYTAALTLAVTVLRLLTVPVHTEQGEALLAASALPYLLQVTAFAFPYMLLVIGVVSMILYVFGYFQTYFSLLISMNVTRRAVVGGLWLSVAGIIAGTMLLSALVWLLTPGEASKAGLTLMPLLTGAFLLLAAVFLLLGAVWSRWGMKRTLLVLLLVIIAATLAGIVLAHTGLRMGIGGPQEITGLLRKQIGFGLLVAGTVSYVLAGLAALRFTKKTEVRV